MPAQRHLAARGEPADMPDTTLFHHEGGLGQVVLGGDTLHQRLIEPGIEAIDHGRIARERLIGKGVNLMKIERHDGFPAIQKHQHACGG